jgi:2-polyprenyl-3-methyl-5-hydroxy-6-metoxy-1,4-benzoquinol methylase
MDKFQHTCEICGNSEWQGIYCGPIRNGSFGSLTDEDCLVAQCENCGSQRLPEEVCRDTSFYEGEEYRNLLKEPTDVSGFCLEHDKMQLLNMSVIWPQSVRDKTVADIGCGGGSFLDHISGLPKNILAIEPCQIYHESLKERGYQVYSLAKDAAAKESGKVDFAFSFSVIEHIHNPREFLADIAKLLSDDGTLVVSTPNRSDVLMSLLAEEYPQFFYRTVHRWYFDVDSFSQCAKYAGLEVVEAKCVHRFGLSNALAWLRDNRPTGNKQLPHLASELLDDVWKRYLEEKGVADYLYFILKRAT